MGSSSKSPKSQKKAPVTNAISKDASLSELSDAGYLRGQILVAMPQMQDTRFNKSLILMCGHDHEGAMGIVFNKVLEDVSFQGLLDQMEFQGDVNDQKRPLYYGGPVEIGRGFVLHSSDYMSEASLLITDDIALTTSTVILQDVALREGPDHALVALGYAGWSPGQLEGELLQNGWLVLPADAMTVFDPNPETLWERTLRKFGIEPSLLSAQAGHA